MIEEIYNEAERIVSLRLGSPDGSPLPAWEPGAHIDVVIPGGLVRQYSLCGRVEDRSSWRVAVLHEPDGRGGSAWIHSQARVGDTLETHGPRNHFALVPANEYLFIAGGIGVTPLLPMVEANVDARRAWTLVYGGRSRSSMAFTDRLVPYGGSVRLWPQDERGLLPVADLVRDAESGTAVYCCGPEPLLAAVEAACDARPDVSLHVERFQPRSIPQRTDDRPFQVELALSGLQMTVEPGTSIADAVASAGVYVPTSCREGTCGTCETVVLEGTPDHRDAFLQPEEREAGDTMMICCSRALTTRLVLEL